MNYRVASLKDCPALAEWNRELILDEGHGNPMTVAELEKRMRDWLTDGGYEGLIFEDGAEPVAYALFRDDESGVYLRQLFVVRHRRREGIGRRSVETLIAEVWPKDKRLTVSVLVSNEGAVAFWRAVGYRNYALTLERMPAPG